MGEEAVVDAIIDVIRQQHSDAVIRNTGIRSQGSFVLRTEYWNRYRETLGEFLTETQIVFSSGLNMLLVKNI